PPLPRNVEGQVLDPGLLNGLRIELHQLHDLDRHINLDGQPKLARFAGGQSVIVCPAPAGQLVGKGFRRRLLHPRRQQLDPAPRLTWATAFSLTSARTSVRSKTLATGFESRAFTMLAAGSPTICGSIGPSTENSPSTISSAASAISVPPDMAYTGT